VIVVLTDSIDTGIAAVAVADITVPDAYDLGLPAFRQGGNE